MQDVRECMEVAEKSVKKVTKALKELRKERKRAFKRHAKSDLSGHLETMKDEILQGVGEMIQEHLSICLSVDGSSFTPSEKEDPHNICIGGPPAFEVGKIKVEEEKDDGLTAVYIDREQYKFWQERLFFFTKLMKEEREGKIRDLLWDIMNHIRLRMIDNATIKD